jgi:hypothetical protein
MSNRAATRPHSRLVRNLVAVGAAAALTLLVFQFMAAFNGVMKLINQITTDMALRCPDGYDLVATADGSKGCTPRPPPTVPGVVPVTLPALPAPADPAPAPKSP